MRGQGVQLFGLGRLQELLDVFTANVETFEPALESLHRQSEEHEGGREQKYSESVHGE